LSEITGIAAGQDFTLSANSKFAIRRGVNDLSVYLVDATTGDFTAVAGNPLVTDANG
jgi:hypothetical protein